VVGIGIEEAGYGKEGVMLRNWVLAENLEANRGEDAPISEQHVLPQFESVRPQGPLTENQIDSGDKSAENAAARNTWGQERSPNESSSKKTTAENPRPRKEPRKKASRMDGPSAAGKKIAALVGGGRAPPAKALRSKSDRKNWPKWRKVRPKCTRARNGVQGKRRRNEGTRYHPRARSAESESSLNPLRGGLDR